jgi:hypothetical protein
MRLTAGPPPLAHLGIALGLAAAVRNACWLVALRILLLTVHFL